MLNEGDMFFVQVHEGGGVLVGQMAIEKELYDLQVTEFQGILQFFQKFSQCFGEGFLLEELLFRLAEVPAGGGVGGGEFSEEVAGLVIITRFVEVLDQANGLGPAVSIGVDEFPPEDREKVSFQAGLGAEIVHSFQESYEGFLNDILGVGLSAHAGLGKGEEPSLEAFQEIGPCLGIAGFDLFEEIAVGLADRAHLLKYPIY